MCSLHILQSSGDRWCMWDAEWLLAVYVGQSSDNYIHFHSDPNSIVKSQSFSFKLVSIEYYDFKDLRSSLIIPENVVVDIRGEKDVSTRSRQNLLKLWQHRQCRPQKTGCRNTSINVLQYIHCKACTAAHNCERTNQYIQFNSIALPSISTD